MTTDRSLMDDGFEPLHQRVTDIDAALIKELMVFINIQDRHQDML